MSVTTLTPPTALPVSVAEIIAHLRLSDGEDPGYLTDLIHQAAAMVEKETRRALMPRTLRLTLDGFPGPSSVELPRPPLVSVTAITYDDPDDQAQTLASSEYKAVTGHTPGRVSLKPGRAWPSTLAMPGAVRIDYVAGYATAGAIPADLRAAVKLLVGHLYENREASAPGTLNVIPLGARRILDNWYMPEGI